MDFQNTIKAALFDINQRYFAQKTIVEKRYKYNERVLCYEFYHQLRNRENEFNELTISGEAVKSNFQFNDLKKNITPDLLIHNFGKIENNEVVIEVKTSKNKSSVINGLKKDFISLNKFTNQNIDYKIGIYLLVNHDFWKIMESKSKAVATVTRFINSNARIVVWNIANPQFDLNGKLKEESLKIYSNDKLRSRINTQSNDN